MQLHHTHMTNDALVRYMDAAAEVYAKYNVNGALQDPVQNGQRWSLEAAMGCYESLYILEASENGTRATCSSAIVKRVSKQPPVCTWCSLVWCVMQNSLCRRSVWEQLSQAVAYVEGRV